MSETEKERKSQTSEGGQNDGEREPMGGGREEEKKNPQERNDDGSQCQATTEAKL